MESPLTATGTPEQLNVLRLRADGPLDSDA
jgi:hypothetical protein